MISLTFSYDVPMMFLCFSYDSPMIIRGLAGARGAPPEYYEFKLSGPQFWDKGKWLGTVSGSKPRHSRETKWSSVACGPQTHNTRVLNGFLDQWLMVYDSWCMQDGSLLGAHGS